MATATTKGPEKHRLPLLLSPDDLDKVLRCSAQGRQGPAKFPYMLVLLGEQGSRDPCNTNSCEASLHGGSCPHGDDCNRAHDFHPSVHSLFSDSQDRMIPMKCYGSYHSERPVFNEFSHNQDKEGKALPAHHDLSNVQFSRYPHQLSGFNKAHGVGLAIILGDQVEGHEGYEPYAKNSEAFSCNNANLGIHNNKIGGAVYVSSGGPAGPQEYYHFTRDSVPADYKYYLNLKMIPKHSEDTAATNILNESVKIIQPTGLPTMPVGNSASIVGVVAGYGRRLIADTGATMHAVGDYRLLRGVKLYTTPIWVTLPDDTRRCIAGIGRIEWENFSIPNVYLVEGFQKSLISISQLDRDHGMHSTFGQGIGRIMLADGTVVGGAFLDENDGMYVFRFLEVPE